MPEDANGNILSDPSVKSYTWDFENRLTQVTVPQTGDGSSIVAFKYDPFGQRVQKSLALGTTNYLYDGMALLAEFDNPGNVLARYTQGKIVDEPLAQLRSGTTSYYQSDALGSITSLSGSGGTLVNTYVYDSFGNATASTGALVNAFQYTARDFDSETGLRYYRSRYYDQMIGRFTTEDFARSRAGVNFYSYVGGNPVRYADPVGKEHADQQEIRGAIRCAGWGGAYTANQLRYQALSAAEAWLQQHGFPPTSLHNGEADAYRHCLWSCLMSQQLGVNVAECIGDNHELAGNRHGQPPDEEAMDRANNAAGRQCLRRHRPCDEACTEAFTHGELFGLGGRRDDF